MEELEQNSKPEKTIEKIALKPIRWSIALVTLALITSLTISGLVSDISRIKSEFYSTIGQLENQLTTVIASQKRIPLATEKIDSLEIQLPRESDRIIIKFKDTDLPPGLSVAAEKANLEKAQGLNQLFTIKGIDANVYRISEDDTASEVVNRIKERKNSVVEYTEVDMLVPLAYTPNDLDLSKSWHINKIQAPLAWDSAQGEGIIIAIADTGVDCTHSDLADNCIPGWNVVSNNNDTTDIHGHGTAVAGAAAEIGDNTIGTAGVAYKAKIMPLRITNSSDGWAYFSDIARAFTWAADNGAKIASASYGVCDSTSVISAAKYLRSKGGVATAAGMNNGEDPGFANSEYLTCVSATNSSDTRTSWSNFGAYIDVSAPGASIYSTRRGGSYGNHNGTSFSTPLTAGVYSLIFAANPDLTPLQADNILFSSVDDLGDPGWDKYYGHGRINAGVAVAAAMATIGTRDTTPPSIPQNLQATEIKSNSVVLEWSSSIDDNSGVAGYIIYRDNNRLTTVAGTKYTDSNLSPNNTYIYTIRAEDGEGNVSSDSNPLSVTTPDIDFAISSHSVSTKTDTTATISTSLTKPGTITIKYGTGSSNLDMTVHSNLELIDHILNLSGLLPSTTYYYQVIASDGITEASSNISSFKTNKASRGGGGGGKPKR